MKILIITFNFGKTSSGKTTERIADGLYKKGHQIEVLCANNYAFSKNYTVHVANPKPLKPSKIFKSVGNIFGKELNYIFWELRAKSLGCKIVSKFQPDILYSRGSPVASMTVGNFLKNKYGVPHVVHFADPIPPTIDWMKNMTERKKLLKTIRPIINNANIISFVTDEMRAYQYKILKEEVDFSKTFICPNPMPNFRYFGKPLNDIFIFLYLGTFSKQRNPKLIIEAFQDFAVNKRNVEFHIYGNKSNKKLFNQLDLNSSNVKLFDPLDDINKIFEKANVLVDVDANLNEPVFISGKLMEYLSVDRFIFAISPLNSPSRRILKPLKSTAKVVSPIKEEIIKEMENIFQIKWNDQNYFERNLMENYSFKGVIEKIHYNFCLQNKT